MKVYQVDCKGLDGLQQVELPAPNDPGPEEVLVDVHAVSLNYRDLLVAIGRYGGIPERPFVAASDMAGVVAKVGSGVTTWRLGDRVANAPFRCWPAGTLRGDWARTFVGGAGVDGVLAEQVLYPAGALVKLPSHLSFEEGSTLTVAGLTAWAGLVTHGGMRAGDWVLLEGTGGVSLFGAQLAQLFGARTILTTASEEKAALVKQKLGVRHTVNYRDADWPRQVVKLTGGVGVDVVLDVAGGETLAKAIKTCAYGARVSVVGILAGLESTINIIDLLQHQITVRGIYMESTEELIAFARALEAGQVKPWIDRVFPFEQARQAYEHLASQQHMGKVVIQVKT